MSELAKDLDRHFRQQLMELAGRHLSVMMDVAPSADVIVSMYRGGLDLICSAVATAAGNAKDGRDAAIADMMVQHIAAILLSEKQAIVEKARAAVAAERAKAA